MAAKGTVIFGGEGEVPALGSHLKETCSFKLKHLFKTETHQLQLHKFHWFVGFFFFSFDLDPFLYNARWSEVGVVTGKKPEVKFPVLIFLYGWIPQKEYNATLST